MRPTTIAMAVAATAMATVALSPGFGSAHSLASSSVTVELTTDDMAVNVTLAVASLDQAFDAGSRSDDLADATFEAQTARYVEDHLEVTGPDGTVWTDTASGLSRRTDEGIETISIDLDIDVVGDDPSVFAITYDAIIEAVAGHDAVLVFVDATNRASTPGVFTESQSTIDIGGTSTSTGVLDMVGHGFNHVLAGADHLLFLLVLLLPAPLVVADRRWQQGPGRVRSLRKVAHVVTAFTVGHSATLVATALGWISVPSRPVEAAIAVSVAVSAIHAIRPLARRGEPMIAAAFGLVHGMAFAGILTDLGVDVTTSLPTLAAFNIGIELAQLAAVACVFPWLSLMSTRRTYSQVRIGGACVALVAASFWFADRIGLLASPITSVEDTLVDRPWIVVGAIATLAVALVLLDRPPRRAAAA